MNRRKAWIGHPMKAIASALTLAALLLSGASTAAEPCKLTDADVRVSRWYDEQNMKMYFKVVGELINNCNELTGIQIRFVGRDSKGDLVAVNELWPASIRNIPPHSRSPFSTNAFPYDHSIKTLTAEVIEVKQWRQ
jgi:hypothetical protein